MSAPIGQKLEPDPFIVVEVPRGCLPKGVCAVGVIFENNSWVNAEQLNNNHIRIKRFGFKSQAAATSDLINRLTKNFH